MIANHKGEIPAVVILMPFLFGIGFGINLFPNTSTVWLSFIFIALSITFIALNLCYNKFNLYKNRWIGGSLITIIVFVLGWLSVIQYNELNNSDHFSNFESRYLVVKINNEPTLKNGLTRFTVEVEAAVGEDKKITKVTGTLLIATKDTTAKSLYYGDEILIPSKYNPVDPPFNPAEFNYKKYLAGQNIFYQAFLMPKQFKIIKTNTGNPVIAYSLRLRQQLVEKFKRNMRDTDAIAVASTLILGYKADLSNDVLQAYSKTGTVHVLSVSGAHVAIIYILLALALGWLDKLKHGKLVKAFIIIILIWYYSLLSGFSPAVCRAAVMISMVIIGKTYSRYINTINILAISAFMLLVYDPFFILDVGFQLSYLAVCGLIIFQPIVYKWFTIKNKWADKLWALCSVSIAAQVITFPLSAFYFHQFPVYFLISNLFIGIPTAVIMYSGIVYLMLPQIPFISAGIAFILEKSILIMNKGLAIIEFTPYASIGKIWLTIPEYLLLYLIIISVFYFMYDKKVWLIKLTGVCLLVLCISIGLKSMMQSQSNTIAWLNIKKNPTIIFKRGDYATILSDVKTTDKTWQYSIQPYLDSCRISNIQQFGLSQNIKTKYLLKRNGFVQFMNNRIYIFNGQLNDTALQKKINTDYIYLTGNPYQGLKTINHNFNYKLLIADGSNSERLIREVSVDAEIRDYNLKVLKRNKSLITSSN